MDKRKIVKWTIFLAIVVCLAFVVKKNMPGNVWKYIINWNLEFVKENAIGLFLVYWIEILIVLALWDLFMYGIYIHMYLLLGEKAEYFLQMNKIRLTIWCVRLKYGMSKMMFFLRLGWWKSGSSGDNDVVWNNIKRPTIKNTLLNVCTSMIKLPALIALFLTAVSLEWFEVSDILVQLNNLYDMEFDFWNFAKNLSPLITVILVMFIGYFISFRGSIRRSIAQANRKKMEDIIQQHRILIEAMGMSLHSIASNIEYVINCKELVVDLWIHNRFPDYKNEECILQRDWNLESFCFECIPELKDMVDVFERLNSNGNGDVSRTFASYKYEFLTLVSHTSHFSVKKLNEKLFTKQGMESMLADDRRTHVEHSKEEIEQIRSNYLEYMPGRIVESLELLYIFYRYYDEMSKLLNVRSDKVGRALRMLTGKE